MIESETLPIVHRKRSSLAMLLVLVACIAMIFWAWRRASETAIANDLASTIRWGSASDRVRAMADLWRVPPEQARTASSALFAALDDPDPEVRDRATDSLFYALQAIKDPSELAVVRATLLRALSHEDPAVRVCAAGLLGTVRLRVPVSPNTGIMPPNDLPPEVVEALIAATSDTDGEVRGVALNSLANGMSDQSAMSDVMLRAASDPEARVRRIAINHLFRVAHLSREACLTVIHALLDPAHEVRSAAATGQFAVPVKPPTAVLPDLIQVLNDPRSHWQNLQVWRTTLSHLEAMGSSGQPALPALARFFPTRVMPFHEYEALRTLGAIAPNSVEAQAWIPALIMQLKKPVTGGRGDRHMAFLALGTYLWSPEVIAAMRELADDSDPSMKAMAKSLLKTLPNSTDEILP